MTMEVISILQPTRCTNVPTLFYFGMTLYMFRTVFPSIIRSSRLYIQQQAFVCLLASRQQYLCDKCLLLYVQSWNPDDGRKDHPKHVECHSKIKYIWCIGAPTWFYYRNNITMHDPMNVKFVHGSFIHIYFYAVKYTSSMQMLFI